MRQIAFAAVLTFAACAAPHVAERTAAVPLGAAVPKADLAKDQGLRAAADRSAPLPESATPSLASSVASVSYRTVTEVVETPAPQPVAETAPGYAYDTSYAGAGGYYYPYAPVRRYREPWFPVGTVVGASIGAAFDHGHWHHGRGHWHGNGALIGGGIGLLFDLPRLWR